MVLSRRWKMLGVVVVGGLSLVLVVGSLMFPTASETASEAVETAESSGTAEAPAFDARRAGAYLAKICDIGPRISGSAGMEEQQKLLAEHFTELGATVGYQPFDVRHPKSGEPVRMNNLIVSWNPEAQERVLIACHYDTRPLPDRDPDPDKARRGTFIGANDGASGVALLMEMGHHLAGLKTTYGVDFVFFDGEELVYSDRDPYFLGSEHFAKDYRDHPPEHKYVYGVVVDMIGDKNLAIYIEKNSLYYARELTNSVWRTARRLGVKEFIPRSKFDIRDDHLALNEIAGIPACDIIDFDFPHWHTTKDVASACSGESLAKVGKVLLAWLTEVPPPKGKRK